MIGRIAYSVSRYAPKMYRVLVWREEDEAGDVRTTLYRVVVPSVTREEALAIARSNARMHRARQEELKS
jgi:hypothetical protein